MPELFFCVCAFSAIHLLVIPAIVLLILSIILKIDECAVEIKMFKYIYAVGMFQLLKRYGRTKIKPPN